MGLLSRYFKEDIVQAYHAKEAMSMRKNFAPESPKKKFKNFLIKTAGFINSFNVGREIFAYPEYDFEEIKRATEADSYLKSSLSKYSRLIYKAGYYLKSENQQCVDYLNTRFRIMSYASGKPMDILFQEVADDVIKYSNAFLVKTRIKQIMPGIKAKSIYDSGVVGAYSRIDPSTISIQRDECGNIISYIQKVVNGKEKKYKPEDIIHFYMDKESSNAFGTPKVIAALEDIKILRKLEGNVLAIVHRFAMPIFHWKIGKPQQGFQATDPEIEEAKQEIEGMALEGVVITNEKTEINVLGSQGNAIDVTNYLKYFEARVLTALDNAGAIMGKSGDKQNADSMEAQTHDYVKYVQKVLAIFFENFVLSELLLEGGFNPILNSSDITNYVFNEISLDTKIKVENHELLKWQSNMQTCKEARRNIGYKEDIDVNELYKNSIEVPAQIKIIQATSKAQSNAQIKTAKETAKYITQGQGSFGNMSNGKKPGQNPNKDAENRNRPENQSGKTSVKIEESLGLNEKVTRSKKNHKKKYEDIYSKLTKLRNNITKTESDIDYLFSLTKDSLMQDMKILIQQASNEGIVQAIKDLNSMKVDTNVIAATHILLSQFYENSDSTIKNIFQDMRQRINEDREINHVDSVMDALEYRFRFLIEHVLPKTMWYSYLKAGEKAGIENADIVFNGSPDEKKYPSTVSTKSFSINDIPAFHPFCNCKIKFKR